MNNGKGAQSPPTDKGPLLIAVRQPDGSWVVPVRKIKMGFRFHEWGYYVAWPHTIN